MCFKPPEDNDSQTKIDFITFMKEAAKLGSSIARNSKSVLWYFPAIQGRTGGDMSAPELMGHAAVPQKLREFVFHRGWSSSLEDEKVNKEGRPSCFRSIWSMTKRNSATTSPSREKSITKAHEKRLRTQSIGSI